jgi:hypothetical protein
MKMTAERAVRAGLALIDAVVALSAKDPLQVRIGAATGMVVVGDLVRSGEAQERGIVGETPTSRHAFRASPSRTRSLLPRPRASCWAISSSCVTSG